MATLITKNSSTASSIPTAAQLVQGELAVNVADKRIFTENSAGAIVELGVNPSSITTGILTASGTVGIGTAASFPGVGSKVSVAWDPSSQQGVVLKAFSTSFTGNAILFRNNADVSSGAIFQTQTAVAYQTSSDYRLKENIKPMVGALLTVAQLKPVTYKWRINGEDGQGFIAHELQEIVPDCVGGEKDAVGEDGKPKYQGIDTSFLVATLAAAIQELKAIVDSQAGKIAALEAK